MSKLKKLYAEIWAERPHVCANCGVPIYEPLAHNFAHIRSKGARPDLKYDKANIEILCSTWDKMNRYMKRSGCHELQHAGALEYKERGRNYRNMKTIEL